MDASLRDFISKLYLLQSAPLPSGCTFRLFAHCRGDADARMPAHAAAGGGARAADWPVVSPWVVVEAGGPEAGAIPEPLTRIIRSCAGTRSGVDVTAYIEERNVSRSDAAQPPQHRPQMPSPQTQGLASSAWAQSGSALPPASSQAALVPRSSAPAASYVPARASQLTYGGAVDWGRPMDATAGAASATPAAAAAYYHADDDEDEGEGDSRYGGTFKRPKQ